MNGIDTINHYWALAGGSLLLLVLSWLLYATQQYRRLDVATLVGAVFLFGIGTGSKVDIQWDSKGMHWRLSEITGHNSLDGIALVSANPNYRDELPDKVRHLLTKAGATSIKTHVDGAAIYGEWVSYDGLNEVYKGDDLFGLEALQPPENRGEIPDAK